MFLIIKKILILITAGISGLFGLFNTPELINTPTPIPSPAFFITKSPTPILTITPTPKPKPSSNLNLTSSPTPSPTPLPSPTFTPTPQIVYVNLPTPTPQIIYVTPFPTPIPTPIPTPKPTPTPLPIPITQSEFITQSQIIAPMFISTVDYCFDHYPNTTLFYAERLLIAYQYGGSSSELNSFFTANPSRIEQAKQENDETLTYTDCQSRSIDVQTHIQFFSNYGLHSDEANPIFQKLLVDYLKNK